MQEKNEQTFKQVQMRYTITKLKSYNAQRFDSKTNWVFTLQDGSEMTFADFEMMGYVLSACFPYKEENEDGTFFIWARVETTPQTYIVT